MSLLLVRYKEAWEYDARRSSANVREFVERHPELPLDNVADGRDVIALLDRGSRLTQVEKAAVISALLVDAIDPTLAALLVRALLPGLIGVCRKLRWGGDAGGDEFLSDAISTLTEVVAEWAGRHRNYAGPDLLNATRMRLRRMVMPIHTMARLTGDATDALAADDAPSLRGLALRIDEALLNDPDRALAVGIYAVAQGHRPTAVAAALGMRCDTFQREAARFITKHQLLEGEQA